MSAFIRNIVDSSTQLPDFLILDTSLLLELVPSAPPHPHHKIAVNFLNHLRLVARRDEVIPIIPYLVLEEFYFKICQKHLEAVGQRSGIRWQEYYKQNPLFISTTIHPILVQFYRMLRAFPMIILEPEDLALSSNPRTQTISDCMTDFINQFNILPKDATILSEARRIGVFHIATLDRDFERADGFTVFLPI